MFGQAREHVSTALEGDPLHVFSAEFDQYEEVFFSLAPFEGRLPGTSPRMSVSVSVSLSLSVSVSDSNMSPRPHTMMTCLTARNSHTHTMLAQARRRRRTFRDPTWRGSNWAQSGEPCAPLQPPAAALHANFGPLRLQSLITPPPPPPQVPRGPRQGRIHRLE